MTDSARRGRAPTPPRRERPRGETPIVPRNSIAGRALVAVIAIMTFLVCLTTGGGDAGARGGRRLAGRRLRARSRCRCAGERPRYRCRREAAAGIAGARLTGVAEVHPYSKEESAQLLQPWLGEGLKLDDLPIPRLIVVRIAPGATPDWRRCARR